MLGSSDCCQRLAHSEQFVSHEVVSPGSRIRPKYTQTVSTYDLHASFAQFVQPVSSYTLYQPCTRTNLA
jgi:hypothetical protein